MGAAGAIAVHRSGPGTSGFAGVFLLLYLFWVTHDCKSRGKETGNNPIGRKTRTIGFLFL